MTDYSSIYGLPPSEAPASAGLPPPYPSAPAYDVPPTSAAAAVPPAYPTYPVASDGAVPPVYPTSTPMGTPSAPVETPGDCSAAVTTKVYQPAVPSTPVAIGKDVMFFGVKDTVYCRDMGVKGTDGKSREIWRRTLGNGSSVLHFNDVFVAYCSGIVVARLLDKLYGLDAATGEVKWSVSLGGYGLYDIVTFVIDGFYLYAGVSTYVNAISMVDGKVLWTHRLCKVASLPLLTIAPCGVSVFAATSRNMVLLNKTDGSVRWDISLPFTNSPSGRAMTAAWDGENTIMIGAGGYLYPVDLRTGEMKPRINLKGTMWHHVGLMFDAGRKLFYALSHGLLVAVRADGAIQWSSSVLSGYFPALAFEPTFGRIYISDRNDVQCVDANDGKLIFSKTYPVPFLSRKVNVVTQDLVGSGKIFIGFGGCLLVIDGEGNIVEIDELKGMGYHQVFACTPTASMDTNACADCCHRYEYRRPKN